MTQGWAPGPSDQPLPPQNGMVISPFTPGMLDLRWDDPNLLGGNSIYNVVGVNVYRSDASDRGPYFRVNEFPVGGAFYRDRTDNTQVREVVRWADDWIFKGDAPNDRTWVFRTRHPIVKQKDAGPFQRPTPANTPKDVKVWIDGVEVPVNGVFGPTGEVTLINRETFDVATEKREAAILPTANSTVEILYYTNRNHVRSGLGAKVFYRLTTVVLDTTTPSGYNETNLSYTPPLSNLEVERLDYIWREAIRRNHWILQQGGERVKVFVRKMCGIPCSCGLDQETREYSKQPSNRCLTCFGTGWVGGYEGPYDVIVAPDDAERRLAQSQFGRRLEHTYEVFMGPSPLLTQRDFVVKQTNERYSVGAVRRPTNRGNLLQQHFSVGYLDEQDIRYQVPIDGTDALVWPQTRYGFRHVPALPVDGSLPDVGSWCPPEVPYPTGSTAQTPMATEKDNIPNEREQRGRSPVWENQNN